MGFVYGLFDPRMGALRYIGKTVRSVASRLSQHLAESKKRERNHKSNWIRSLLVLGLKPEVDVLEDVPDDQLSEVECFWIQYFRGIGAVLTNATDGGEGALGWVPSESWRHKHSVFMKGKQYSLGVRPSKNTRAKMSMSHKGKTTGQHSKDRIKKNSASQGGRPLVDESGNRYETPYAAARALGCLVSGVQHVLKGRRSHHHGHVFRYLEE